VSYRAPGNTRDQVEGGASSVGAGQGQTRLPRGLLGLAAQPTSGRVLATTSELLRLSQARGHLCAREIFVHQVVHHQLVSVLVRVDQGSAFQVMDG
jgi:hypothetical protein